MTLIQSIEPIYIKLTCKKGYEFHFISEINQTIYLKVK